MSQTKPMVSSTAKLTDDMQRWVCSRCIMDRTDPDIIFDSDGICNHCREFERASVTTWFPSSEGAHLWRRIVDRVRMEGAQQEYDCILGLSGGVDSSYLALKARDWGLRPLIVHVDAGWNSELAVANIEAIVKHCGYDLHTQVVDWDEMRDLQLAYLKAGVANQDVPQDHIFFSSLYHFAIKNKIRYVLSGGNMATEGIFPSAWHGSAMDEINLLAIHKKFGSIPLRNYKTISFFEYYFKYPVIKRMKTLRPLNFMAYNKDQAIRELEAKVGWRSYGRKHGESLFTKFFQNYYLPQKFGYDKRKPHLSSLIVSGQMSREQALREMEKPLYDPHELENDIDYFCKKLRISREEFFVLMRAPSRHYSEFPSWDKRYRLLKSLQAFIGKVSGRSLKAYS